MEQDLSILFIEDSEDDVSLVLRELRKGGYAARWTRVETAEEMFRELMTGQYEIVISDHNLPRFSALEALKTLHESGQDLPFIIVSGIIGETSAVEAMRAGAHDYIMKENLTRLVPAVTREIRETRRRQEQKRIIEENLRLASFPRENPYPVLSADREGTIHYKNPATDSFVSELGVELDQFLPSNHRELAWQTLETSRGFGNLEVNIGGRHFSWTYTPALSTNLVYIYALEITRRKEAEERIYFLAYHDDLTGLPNRAFLMNRLTEALHLLKVDEHRGFAILFLDVDRFNLINDTLGHLRGDELLVQMTDRLRKCAYEEDFLARLGGDEFLFLLENLKGAESEKRVARLIRSIQNCFSAPFNLSGMDVFATVSMGVAFGSADVEDPVDLLRRADMAMYSAKDDGRNTFHFYSSQMKERIQSRLILDSALRQALENDEFSLYYQPQVDLRKGRIVAMEALLRWEHPTMGSVPPSRFIPHAEETGLILPLGSRVIEEACGTLREWMDAGLPPVLMSINLSVMQFRQSGLVEFIRNILDRTKVEPDMLELEITESSLMRHEEQNLSILRDLGGMGIRIAIDDFGTGYSSLSYLKNFPVEAVKIDRSFIKDLPGNEGDIQLAKAIVAMAHSMKLMTIAEGVETVEQLGFLKDLGCDRMQGYLFSHALPSWEVARLLKDEGRALFEQLMERIPGSAGPGKNY